MKLSIVTITFNNFEDLVKTCASIPRRRDVEHIVINGGNCEKTKNFLQKNSHIHSVSEKDSGISDAFNKGVQRATGDGIWFLNSGDILIDPTYPDFALDHIQNCHFVHSNLAIETGSTLDVLQPNLKAHLLWGMPCFHPTMIVRRDVFQQVGPFSLDYKIAMDLDFLARMKKSHFFENKYYPHTTVIMDGSGISNTRPLAGLKENRRIITSYFGWGLTESFELSKIIRSLVLNKVAKTFWLKKPLARFKKLYKSLK